jgi:hypothetical protein
MKAIEKYKFIIYGPHPQKINNPYIATNTAYFVRLINIGLMHSWYKLPYSK